MPSQAEHRFVFGVFSNGKPVFLLGSTTTTHRRAALIVAILDQAKHALRPGHYFACDYKENQI